MRFSLFLPCQNFPVQSERVVSVTLAAFPRSKHFYVCPIICHRKTMLVSPDLLIIPLLCAARNMDPDTSGAEVPAANVASYRGHLYFFLVLGKSQSWKSQLSQHTVRCRLISIASEIKYHLKLARSHQFSQVESSSEMSSSFSVEAKTLALKASERAANRGLDFMN